MRKAAGAQRNGASDEQRRSVSYSPPASPPPTLSGSVGTAQPARRNAQKRSMRAKGWWVGSRTGPRRLRAVEGRECRPGCLGRLLERHRRDEQPPPCLALPTSSVSERFSSLWLPHLAGAAAGRRPRAGRACRTGLPTGEKEHARAFRRPSRRERRWGDRFSGESSVSAWYTRRNRKERRRVLFHAFDAADLLAAAVEEAVQQVGRDVGALGRALGAEGLGGRRRSEVKG